MKRMLLPAAVLACAAACAPAPSNTSNTNANMSNMNMSNSNASNTNGSASNVSESDLMAREREVYDDFKKKDTAAFGAQLTDDFIYVGPEPGGPADKAATIKIVEATNLTDITFSDSKVLQIDKDAAVLYYNSHDTGTGPDKKPFDDNDRESTVWVNRGGKWIAIFHQDCHVRPMPPAPAGNANSNSNASANSNKPAPASSPAAPTSDAVANEKAVWDAIRRGDANAFAGYLADDAIEVEPEKVYTKSESVGSVPNIAFLSSAVLSDFKTVKIDDDATIVTYNVKGTGPDHKPFTEHHSTVWANRGGTWKAIFHHGSPVGPPPSGSQAANANKSANANK